MLYIRCIPRIKPIRHAQCQWILVLLLGIQFVQNLFYQGWLHFNYLFISMKGLKAIVTIFFLAVNFTLAAQEGTLIAGLVESDSVQLQDIHVLNLSTLQGTITNANGEFRITVSVTDTLIFSGIQFHTLGLIVDENIVRQRKIKIELQPKIEELSEIELQGHDLDGLFYIDTKRLRDSLPLVSDTAVDFSEQGYDDPTSSNYVVPAVSLVNLVTMIGKKKRKEKKEEDNLIEKKRQAPANLRNELGDDVFVNQMDIPKVHIEPFIRYCQKKNILDLYVDGRLMEVIDILIKEKENYRRERILIK